MLFVEPGHRQRRIGGIQRRATMAPPITLGLGRTRAANATPFQRSDWSFDVGQPARDVVIGARPCRCLRRVFEGRAALKVYFCQIEHEARVRFKEQGSIK